MRWTDKESQLKKFEKDFLIIFKRYEMMWVSTGGIWWVKLSKFIFKELKVLKKQKRNISQCWDSNLGLNFYKSGSSHLRTEMGSNHLK